MFYALVWAGAATSTLVALRSIFIMSANLRSITIFAMMFISAMDTKGLGTANPTIPLSYLVRTFLFDTANIGSFI